MGSGNSASERCRYRWAVRIGLTLLAVLPTPSAAQTQPFDEFHTWTDLATIYNVSDRFRYDGDYGVRGGLTDRDWTLVYVRPSVRYQAARWVSLHGGVGLFYNFLPGEDLPELRPWVGVRLLGPRPGGFAVSNYVRLETRAFYLKSASQWDVGLRARWQFQVTSPRFSIGSSRDFDVLVSVEPFFDLQSTANDLFGDRFRFNLGVRKQVTTALRINLSYLFHKVRVKDAGGELDFDDHVVRLRFTYVFHS